MKFDPERVPSESTSGENHNEVRGRAKTTRPVARQPYAKNDEETYLIDLNQIRENYTNKKLKTFPNMWSGHTGTSGTSEGLSKHKNTV